MKVYKLGSMNMVVTMIGVLLLLTETTKVLIAFLASLLILAAFMFGNTSKTIFEFVFVMHPYDVGDRCVIDDSEMVVEEMSILTTVFLKSNNAKVVYPNSVLSTKPIINYSRSPDRSDSLEFCINFKTTMEKITALTEKIKEYLEKNPQHLHRNSKLVIENSNKIKSYSLSNTR